MIAWVRSVAGRVALSIAALVGAGHALAADVGLDGQLLLEAPTILKYCRDKGFKNVGLLKFQIKKGSQPATHGGGALAVELPRRLETALLLKDDPKAPLGIIHNAGAVAAKIPGATHLTAEGRQKLFSAKYNLGWQSPPVAADAFLVGVVQLSEDRRSMKIHVWAVTPAGGEPDRVVKFDVVPDGGDLAETGESFVVRGIFSGGKVEMTQLASAESATSHAADSAVKIKQASSASEHPASPTNHEAPVELEVRYDNAKIPFEIHDGQAFLVEPQDNQKVSFILKRKAADSARYAVVLKVNGENTIERQRLKDINCRKWVIEPNSQPLSITGFQMPNDSAEAFRVLSRAESKDKEIDYGDNVGTISMVVFKETTPAVASVPGGAPSAPSAPAPPDAPAAPSAPSAASSASTSTGSSTSSGSSSQSGSTPAVPTGAAPPDAPSAPPAAPSAPAAPAETRVAKEAKETKKANAADDEDFATLTRGVFPSTPPRNRDALIAQLGSSIKKEGLTRGLIVAGQQVVSREKRVTFNADPSPVMSITLTYYPRAH